MTVEILDKLFYLKGVVKKQIRINYFTKEHEMYRESLRDFLNKEVKGNINKWESKQKIINWINSFIENSQTATEFGLKIYHKHFMIIQNMKN